jgi:hypothetical protein
MGMTPSAHIDQQVIGSGSMRHQIAAFFTGALLTAAGLTMVFFLFVGPNIQTVDPVAAWCRGWIDGLAYTDFKSGNDYEPSLLDAAEAQCRDRVEAGLVAPATRGPLPDET